MTSSAAKRIFGLPSFSGNLLPVGDYVMTIDEVRESHLVTGIGSGSNTWDEKWRLMLVHNLDVISQQLWEVDIKEIFIDGSFVEKKDHPNDIDGYFDVDLHRIADGSLLRDLNNVDPFQSWTWDERQRRFDVNSAKRQLPMWFRYRVELYPNYNQPCGIRDRHGHPKLFPSAFRSTRTTDEPKGIVVLVPSN